MQDVLQHIDKIEKQAVLLGQKLKALENEKSSLIEENLNLKKDLEQLRKSNMELQSESQTASNSGRGKISGEMQHAMKKELDFYIKEVDKCIQLMENIV